MPQMSEEVLVSARKQLKRKKVFDFPTLLFLLNCSVRSGRKWIKQWQVHTSYNKRGQYYALAEVPRFDEHGLWRHKGAFFSKWGTLKNTVVHLVEDSASGLSGVQIGDLVGLDPRSFLHQYRDAAGIRREKHQGVYVYFSDQTARYKEQLAARMENTAQEISDADALMILVAVINHHGIEPEALAALPEVRARNISAEAIGSYLAHHGLKKTPHSKR